MKTLLRRFAHDKRGNFAMMSAFAAIPIVMAVGMALDLSTITRKKSELQQATDAAALAIAREGSKISDLQAREIAERFLEGILTVSYTNLKINRNGARVTVQADIDADVSFSALFGYKDGSLTAASTADVAYASYEIALVLDTTGSMAGGKLAAMKDAVIGLVDTMSKQVDDKDKLKFSLVPFATFVNVGPNFGPSFDKKGRQLAGTGADWLDLKGASGLPQVEFSEGASRFQIFANLGQKWPGCIETRYSEGFDVNDTPTDPSKPSTLYVPAFAIDEPDVGYPNSYIKSNAVPNDATPREKKRRFAKYGVATDNAGNPLLGGLLDPLLEDVLGIPVGNNGQKTIPIDTSVSQGLPKGPGRGCDTAPIVPLSNDYAGLKAKVNNFKASGTTNITEGVAWGLRVLSPGAPFSEGADRKKTGVEKIMIVLTDGSNVFGNASNELGSSYSSNGYLVDGRLGIQAGSASATNTAMNERTVAACTAAKAEGTEVYTIRLEEPNVATGNMLQECATDPEHYFDVPTRSKLDEAFGKIKEKIVRVRIAS